jgi:hypothetical protein
MNYMAGIDWRSVFQGIPALATANAIAMAWAPITGHPPAVVREGVGYAVIFDEDQEERAAQWIRMQLRHGVGSDGEPNRLVVRMDGIARKVIFREYWPYMAGMLLAGAVVGYSLRGRR